MDAKDKRIAELEALLKAALEKIALLKRRIAVLEKNSGNSSKPPSSDIVKPPKGGVAKGERGGKRNRGGQKGHPRYLREPFESAQVDTVVELTMNCCPDCGHELTPTAEPAKTCQRVELVAKPFVVTEYRQATYWCEQCQCFHTAELPTEVKKSGFFGPRLTALTA